MDELYCTLRYRRGKGEHEKEFKWDIRSNRTL